jgi:hypothetical protein
MRALIIKNDKTKYFFKLFAHAKNPQYLIQLHKEQIGGVCFSKQSMAQKEVNKKLYIKKTKTKFNYSNSEVGSFNCKSICIVFYNISFPIL